MEHRHKRRKGGGGHAPPHFFGQYKMALTINDTITATAERTYPNLQSTMTQEKLNNNISRVIIMMLRSTHIHKDSTDLLNNLLTIMIG